MYLPNKWHQWHLPFINFATGNNASRLLSMQLFLYLPNIMKLYFLVSRKDHSDNDCLVIAVLSHGEQGVIYARDACYKPEFLWGSFTPNVCPTLAGKPFFLIVALFSSWAAVGLLTPWTTVAACY